MTEKLKTVLVTGSSGFVGSRFSLLPAEKMLCPTHREMDITDEKSVRSYVEKHQPQVILHAAAMSHIEDCEEHPEAGYLCNVKGTVNMALAARDAGAKLIFCSSDQVYAGCTGEEPLSETMDNLHPSNVYGRQKLEAEEKTLEIDPNAVGLRLTWMFDLPVRGLFTSQNMVMGILKALVKNEKRSLCANDHRGMTYLREVAENIPVMLKAPGGIYNYGSQAFCSTYETFKGVFRALGAEHRMEELLTSFESQEPRNLLMDTKKAAQAGCQFSLTQQGVEKMLREYGLPF